MALLRDSLKKFVPVYSGISTEALPENPEAVDAAGGDERSRYGLLLLWLKGHREH
jgi:hypothetical protein